MARAFWDWYSTHLNDKIDVGLPFGIKLTVRRMKGLFVKLFGPAPVGV